jgi:hypothetical protein
MLNSRVDNACHRDCVNDAMFRSEILSETPYPGYFIRKAKNALCPCICKGFIELSKITICIFTQFHLSWPGILPGYFIRKAKNALCPCICKGFIELSKITICIFTQFQQILIFKGLQSKIVFLMKYSGYTFGNQNSN